MTASLRRFAAGATLCLTLVASPAAADAIFNVSLNTASLAGTNGKIAFDYTVNNPPSGHHVEIVNLMTDGLTAALPETEGGLVEGNVFLPPFTTVGASLSGAVGFGEIGGGSFFNELILNLTFGRSITFQLHIPEYAPSLIPDQFALFLLDLAYLPLFPAADPTGANALFAVDIIGPSNVSAMAFNPAILSGSNLSVTTPGGAAVVPEPTSVSLLLAGLVGLAARKFTADRRF